MKANIENNLLAVVRVRGTVGVRRSISETLQRLNLKRVNNLALIYGTKSNIGMLKKCKDFVTYGEISMDQLKTLLNGKGARISDADIEALVSGSKTARELMSMPIRMHPPKRGYEGIKIGFGAGGALGYRGEEINKLIKRMM